MISIAVPAIVCVLGLILYYFTDPAKHERLKRIGEIMFAVGLFVTLQGLWGGNGLGVGR